MENKTLIDYFSVIEDPRIDRSKRHNLIDILVLGVCGVLSGFDTWVEIADYSKAKKEWFKTFLELPNGIPSHDTFGRVFSLLRPESFQAAFSQWLNSLRKEGFKIINIDGKVLKGSLRKAGDSDSALTLVNAWLSEAGICLGQQKANKSEKDAMEGILDQIFIKGCIVTIDAGGTTADISQKIIDKQGAYLLALKGNQPILQEYAQQCFKQHRFTRYKTKQESHGRVEGREYAQFDILENIDFEEALYHPTREINKLFSSWDHAKSFIQVKSRRKVKGKKIHEETRYYISSLENNLEDSARAIRSHWGIENSLHYILDVTFREDHSRMRLKYAAENMAYLRRMALNMLKNQEPDISIRRKRNKCNWSNDYLEETLFAQI